MKDLRGKNGVVLAAGSGIGRAMARALASEGVNLALLDIDEPALEAIRSEIAATGVKVYAFPLDASERAAIHATADQAERALGDIHVLCDNAGVAFRGKPVDETSEDLFDWMMHVNVFGMYDVLRAYVPRIKRHGHGGHVVITGSVSGLHSMPDRLNGIYTATKMAVVGLAENLRATLPAHGIGVSCLCPGVVVSNATIVGRKRPAKFGGPFEREGSSTPRPGMDAAEIGRIVVRGIQDDEFYLFSHPDDRQYVAARFQAILDGMERWERILPELGIDPKQPAQ
jgi:NAD(P)-dependent dehydrogenase (short-subunit alcohol dehydrogenase family)